MKRIKIFKLIVAAGLLIGSLAACGSGAPAKGKPTSPPEPPKQEAAVSAKVEATAAPQAEAPAEKSEFPLPPNAKIIQSTPEMVIASVAMSVKDAMEFYRADAKTRGFTEYELLTTVSDNVFSMAFRRPNEEKEMVVQGTAISTDNLTLNVRYEETDVK
ncbi:MAG: hypothetical protein GYA15_07460 [Leptolinea sp.]|nr:hypothetical protein [Leptolinea sp.]